jgi:hypothetical protein
MDELAKVVIIAISQFFCILKTGGFQRDDKFKATE